MTVSTTTSPIHLQQNPVLQNVLAYGAETYVPDHDICRLSYYLKCCTIGCGIDIFANLPLIDYQVAHLLHETLQDVIVRLALEVFKLDSLLNKAFILDENHVLLPLGTLNTFYKFELASNFFSIDPITVVAGQRVEVHKVMLCTAKWMREYYILPLIRYQQRQQQQQRQLVPNAVSTTDARLLQGDPQQQVPSSAIQDSSLPSATLHAQSSSSRSCTASLHPTNQAAASTLCAGCHRPMGQQGVVVYEASYYYRCMDCPGDVRLCEPCYVAGEHHDQTHAFAQLRYDGSHRPELLGAQVQALPCSSEGNNCSALLPDLPLAIAVPVFDHDNHNSSVTMGCSNASGPSHADSFAGNEDTPMARAEVA